MVEADPTQLLKLGLAPEDARVLMNWHPNVVLVGTPETTDAVLRVLTPYLRTPVQSLESVRGAAPGSVVLRDLEKLDQREQQVLLQWLDGPGVETQVISLTSARLYSRVQQGTFLSALYYRLNIVHLEPTPIL